jgi:hypothetical protein
MGYSPTRLTLAPYSLTFQLRTDVREGLLAATVMQYPHTLPM